MDNMEKIEELTNKLITTTQRVKHDKFVVEKVKKGMLDLYGILRGQTQRIFSGEVSIQELDKNMLIRFSWELHKVVDDNKIDPHNYFTQKEMQTAKKQDGIKESIEKFPIQIHNAVQVDETTFVAFVDAKDIVKLYNANLLEYNYSINRKYKLVRTKMGMMIQTIDINVREVKEIAEKLLNGKYAVDKVILNVLVGSSTEVGFGKEVTYNKESKELLIHQAKVDIIDGLHDIGALMLAFDTNPDFELKIEVEIKHLDLENVKDFFNKLNIKGGVN